MITYVMPKIEGELLYSRLVRSLALDPESDDSHRAARILGRLGRKVGLLLPAHGTTLLRNVPECSGLNEEGLFAASLFSAAAPVMEEKARQNLRRTCMRSGVMSNVRCLSGRLQESRLLRYCPACARADVAAGRPLHWRTAHQHPGVTGCAEHGVLLIEAATSQRVPYMLFDPAQWIDPSAATPAMASTIEVKIARDLEWLLGGRTVPLPGRKRLGWALHQTFHSRTEYWCDARSVQTEVVIANLRAKHGDAVLTRLGGMPDPGDLWNWVRCALYGGLEMGFERFTLLADLVGLSLQELFAMAMTISARPALPAPDMANVSQAKNTISRVVASRPLEKRSAIYRHCPSACQLMRRVDPTWYENAMPRRKKQDYAGRIESTTVDEVCRDRVIGAYNQITATPKRASRSSLLHGAGLKTAVKSGALARRPKTCAALGALAETDEAFARRRAEAGVAALSQRGEFRTFDQFKRQQKLSHLCARSAGANEAAQAAWRNLTTYLEGPTLFDLRDLREAA
jgi:hypothetical protein